MHFAFRFQGCGGLIGGGSGVITLGADS